MGTLEIHLEHSGERVVVRLTGEFDISGVREFHRALAAVEPGAQIVCIDLHGLSFLGVSGLRSLLDVQRRSRRNSFQLVVVKGPPLVHRVFEMTGIEHRLVMLDDRAEGNGKDPAV